MDCAEFQRNILAPALAQIAPVIGVPCGQDAQRIMLAIAGQESRWTWRYQLSTGGADGSRAGPARGFWQFERRGGVIGVMTHPETRDRAKALCKATHVYWDDDDIWRALEGHNALAAGFARLLLWTDPKSLPKSQEAGWDYYIRNWRPGKPHTHQWPLNWRAAEAALG